MPLVPTTKGNRIKYAAGGENTAVEPIPIIDNPDNPAAPNLGYQGYPGAPQGVTPQLWGGSAQYSNPFVVASPATPQNAASSSYVPAQYGNASDSGAWGQRSKELAPILGRLTPDTKATLYPWPVEAILIGEDENAYPIYKYIAVMKDGTQVDAEWLANQPQSVQDAYWNGTSTDSNDYISKYNSMYELLKKTRKGLTEEQLNQATLQAIGLDDQTLFGGGSGGGSSGISPLAAWQLQSQNWREALPFQVNAGATAPPGWEAGGVMSAMAAQAGLPYNPDVYRTVVSNPPGMPSGGGGGAASALPSWLTQQAPQAPAPSAPISPDFQLFKPEQVTNWMGSSVSPANPTARLTPEDQARVDALMSGIRR